MVEIVKNISAIVATCSEFIAVVVIVTGGIHVLAFAIATFSRV